MIHWGRGGQFFFYLGFTTFLVIFFFIWVLQPTNFQLGQSLGGMKTRDQQEKTHDHLHAELGFSQV